MATETQTQPAPVAEHGGPKYTAVSRVASIPLVNDSLAAVHNTLINYTLTRTPYVAAQAIGSAAYRVSEPIQVRLAPVLERADGYANKGLDAAESRYPYPFKTPTVEIYDDIKRNGEVYVDVANKTIDQKVRSPALGLAEGIDQRFSPVVDTFEVVVNKFSPKANGESSPVEGSSKDKYQYQRAYRLSIDLKDSIYQYTGEQIKQVQEHNVIVQRATVTAHSISEALATYYGATSARVHGLSDTMLCELQKLQTSTAALPAHVQASLSGLSESVGQTIGELRGILTQPDTPINEKAKRLRSMVEDKVNPLLAGASVKIQEAIGYVQNGGNKKAPTANGTANGNGVANGDAKH